MLCATFWFLLFGVFVSCKVLFAERKLMWREYKPTMGNGFGRKTINQRFVWSAWFVSLPEEKALRSRILHRIKTHYVHLFSDVFVRWEIISLIPKKFLPGLSFRTYMAAGTWNSSSRKLMHDKVHYWDRNIITTTITIIILFAFLRWTNEEKKPRPVNEKQTNQKATSSSSGQQQKSRSVSKYGSDPLQFDASR